jgi:hypothetical protein
MPLHLPRIVSARSGPYDPLKPNDGVGILPVRHNNLRRSKHTDLTVSVTAEIRAIVDGCLGISPAYRLCYTGFSSVTCVTARDKCNH